MNIDHNAILDGEYKFTVERISQLHNLLRCVDKKLVNKFITEVRHSVTTYHKHKSEAAQKIRVKAHEQFFFRLNDKSYQLARFTSDLSTLINQAPEGLFEVADDANREIDQIHSHLVNLCLAIDKLSQNKTNFYHDSKQATKDIYTAYQTTFNTTPNGRRFDSLDDIPDDATIEDLLTPVVEILLMKEPGQCYKLVKAVKAAKSIKI